MNEKNKKLSIDPELQSPLKERNLPKRFFTPPKSERKGSSLESSHYTGGEFRSLPPLEVQGTERGEKMMQSLPRGMGEGVLKRTHLGGIASRNSLHRFRYGETDRFILGMRGKLLVNRPFSYQKSSLQSLLFAASLLQKGGRLLVVDTRGDLYSLLTLYTRTDSSSQKGYSLPSHLASSGERWVGVTLTNWADISKKIYQFGDISQKIGPSTLSPLRRYEKRCSAYPGLLEFSNVRGVETRVRRRSIGEGVKLRFQRKPDALFLVNPSRNKGVIAEAAFLKIPVIGFIDSETDPKGITYPIPLNIYSFKESFSFLLTLLRLGASMK
jgi:hypothetical protein